MDAAVAVSFPHLRDLAAHRLTEVWSPYALAKLRNSEAETLGRFAAYLTARRVRRPRPFYFPGMTLPFYMVLMSANPTAN
jgi:hypothetical protein